MYRDVYPVMFFVIIRVYSWIKNQQPKALVLSSTALVFFISGTNFYKIGTDKNISFFNFILLQRNLKSVKNERKNRKESC